LLVSPSSTSSSSSTLSKFQVKTKKKQFFFLISLILSIQMLFFFCFFLDFLVSTKFFLPFFSFHFLHPDRFVFYFDVIFLLQISISISRVSDFQYSVYFPLLGHRRLLLFNGGHSRRRLRRCSSVADSVTERMACFFF